MVFGGGGQGEGVGMALRSAFIALDDEILKRAIVRAPNYCATWLCPSCLACFQVLMCA